MARLDGSKSLKNRVKPHTGFPAKPPGLSDRASREWDRLAKELQEAGYEVTPAHRAAMTSAATIQADIAAAWDVIQKDGEYEVNEKTGTTQMHPAVKRLDALRRDLVKALAILGLRAPDAAEIPQEQEKTTEDILAGK